MQPEFPEYVTNPEVVRELIKDYMVNGIYPLFKFPFKMFGDIKDFERVFKGEGATFAAKCKTGIFSDVGDSSWPVVKFSEGIVKKRFATVLSGDEQSKTDVYFRDEINHVYNEMAWVLVDQICGNFFGKIKENVVSDDLKKISSKFSKWSEPCDVLQQLADLKSFVEKEKGYKLNVVFVNERNYYEFWDHVTFNCLDLDESGGFKSYMKDVQEIYNKAHYLKDLDLWLVGVSDDNEVVSEGTIVGTCSYLGEPLVGILYGYDPQFGQSADEDGNLDTKSLIKGNIPLNINIYKGGSEDEERGDETVKDRITIESWLDFVVSIRDLAGVFYLEDVI